MKVSVCVISYNQELFITKALDSILSQQTDFEYEIIIGDDCSSDGTFPIIQRYQLLYPEKIKILHRVNNLGMMNNFIDTLNNCKGKYVALCEGDDYWIDPLKIQKQVDFLEQNSNYNICFTRVFELINNNLIISPINPWDEEMTFSISDLAAGNFIHTPSVMYRNGVIDGFPSWYSSSPVGDYVLHMLNSKNGLIKYLPQITSVYRKFVGIWSTKSSTYQIRKFIDVVNNLITEDFNSSVINLLKTHKQKLVNEYCLIQFEENNFSYLEEMREELTENSDFINKWMLVTYPERIKDILNSRAYKIGKILSRMKFNL